MAMREIAVKFDEDERASIQDNADAAGMSFSEFVRRAALEKAEGMADIEAYNEALDGDGGTRYPMEEVMRISSVPALKVSLERGSSYSWTPLYCGIKSSI